MPPLIVIEPLKPELLPERFNVPVSSFTMEPSPAIPPVMLVFLMPFTVRTEEPSI